MLSLKNYPVNALCHQEQNFPCHHKGKAIPWVLSFFWHIGKVTYCIFHGGLCLPSFPFLLFYFLSHWQNSLVNWGTLPKCFSLKQYKRNTQLQHNESQFENIGRRNLNQPWTRTVLHHGWLGYNYDLLCLAIGFICQAAIKILWCEISGVSTLVLLMS